jgi:hypothetical protein
MKSQHWVLGLHRERKKKWSYLYVSLSTTPLRRMETEGTSPRILSRFTRQMRTELHAPVSLSSGKSFGNRFYRRLGEAQRRIWRCREEKNLCPHWKSNSGSSVVQPVVWSQYLLSYVGSLYSEGTISIFGLVTLAGLLWVFLVARKVLGKFSNGPAPCIFKSVPAQCSYSSSNLFRFCIISAPETGRLSNQRTNPAGIAKENLF